MRVIPLTAQGLNDLAAFAPAIGVTIEAVKNFVDWVVNTVSGGTEHGTGAGRNSDPNGDK